MALTDTACKQAKPTGKTFRLFDGGGLYLEVSPSGGRWWRLKYRFDHKEKRLSLGTYPDIGLKDARNRRDDARKLLASGADPGANRKALKASRADRVANTFEVLAREWYEKHLSGWAPYASSRLRDLLPKRYPSAPNSFACLTAFSAPSANPFGLMKFRTPFLNA
jgi:hypothetical protein